jgi:hypothetical protein
MKPPARIPARDYSNVFLGLVLVGLTMMVVGLALAAI